MARLRSALTLVVINMVLAVAVEGSTGGPTSAGSSPGCSLGSRPRVSAALDRRLILVVGFLGLLAVAAGLVIWHTNQLQAQFGPF